MKISPDNIADSLKESGVSPTPVRILVYRCLYESGKPLSLTEIETELDTVDKSTVSRTLTIFKKAHLIHSISDGSGSLKYELCHSPHEFESDMHVHFRCERCGSTICLNNVKIPSVSLPEGFEAWGVNYIISGLCNNCSSKNEDKVS